MNEDVFNSSTRRFLKALGVTAQRENEKALRQAMTDGKLKVNEKVLCQGDGYPRGNWLRARNQWRDRT